MQPSSAIEDRSSDVVSVIASSMRSMGVVSLPRNYELFYEVHTGSNSDLSAEFSELGPRPTQEALDALSRKYFAQSDRQALAENAHDQVARHAREIATLLGRERSSLEKFGMILDQTSGGLSGGRTYSHDILQKIVGIMASATETTLEQGKQIARAMAEKSAELETVKEKLAEAKKLADTDPLTRIWNRRAFDRRMSELYRDDKSVMFGALIIADIDDFKAFNDRHGHPVGDKVLQVAARVLRAQGGGNTFVARTGGEEFALVVEGLSEEATTRLAGRLREAIAGADFVVGPSAQNYGQITISLGICMAAEAADPEDLYAKADRALYASKVNGRDRVTQFSSLDAGEPSKNWLIYRND